MSGVYERPATRAGAVALFAAQLALAVFLVAGSAHRFALMDTIGFFWVLGLVCVLAFAALYLATVALRRFWRDDSTGGGAALAALAISILVLSPFGVSAVRALVLPPLSDITTDPFDPPVFLAALKARPPSANPLRRPSADQADLQRRAYPAVTGRRYDAAPDRVLQAVGEVMTANGWQVLTEPDAQPEESEINLEATATSFVFKLPTDVALRITDEGETTYVDMRAASRFAKHDLGENADLIATFLEALDQQMIAAAGA